MSRRAIAKTAKMMNDAGLTEVTVEYGVFFGLIKGKVHLSKQKFCPTTAATGSGGADKGAENPGDFALSPFDHVEIDVRDAVTSPMVGVAYLSPDQNAKPFVETGQSVAAGDTLCLIEAMKTFNPIKSPKDGVVAEILVKDGETVEFGTPLVIVK